MKRTIFLRGVAVLLMMMVTGCSSGSKIDESVPFTSEYEVTMTAAGNESISKVEEAMLFFTEYEIVDYCHGCFIVSKGNGLLYGVLNKKGKEILPVKYDHVIFLNGEELCDGIGETVYILAEHEGSFTVFDESGVQILDKEVKYVKYELKDVSMEEEHFVSYDDVQHKVSFYKTDGTLVSEGDFGTFFDEQLKEAWGNAINRAGCMFLSPDYYLICIGGAMDKVYWNTALYDADNQIVRQWEMSTFLTTTYNVDSSCDFFVRDAIEGIDYVYSIDRDGNLQEKGTVDMNEEYTHDAWSRVVQTRCQHKEEDTYYLNNDIILHKTNNTWKLEKDGKALYDEKYYDCLSESGYYFLENEDQALCLIDKEGDMIVEYGWLTKDGVEVYFKDSRLSADDFCAGDDGVCFITKSADGEKNNIYFFGN